MKKLLNVGGNSREIPLPAHYAGFQQLLLDIDPSGKPDILCDARELATRNPGEFDVIYCSHNLEHYYRHDVSRVLAGFVHVLKPDGWADIRVPDLPELMRRVTEERLELDATLYESPAGPISVLDVVYGFGVEIERSGQDFFAHKTGFSPELLSKSLRQAGFGKVYTTRGNLEIKALAFRTLPTEEARRLFTLVG